MKIIAIHDGNNGHKSQLIGVINSFITEDIEIIEAKNSKLKVLPSFLIERLLFLLNKDLSYIQEPKLIISIGKKSTPYSIYLKKKYPKAKLIFLMPSGLLSQKYGDLIFYHSYKNVNYQNVKYIPIPSAPHLVNEESLLEAKKEWQKEFSKFKKPIISVILGGDAKKIHLTPKAIEELIVEIKKIKEIIEGSVFITTSRRTGLENELYLKEQMGDIISKGEGFFWGYHENDVEQRECELKNSDQKSYKNPYLAMLAISDYAIISGESISMISESASLSSNTGVYIFFSKHFNSKRYTKFHEYLYKNNHAKPIERFTTTWKRTPLNSINLVVEKIKTII